MESQLFQSSTFCKQTAVLLQKHHNILILKSRLSKHNRWETRRQVWQLIFWYLLQRYFSFCFPSFAAVHLFHLSVIKHTSFTILLVAYFNEIQSLFYEQTYRALNEKWKFRYHKEIVTKIMVRKEKNTTKATTPNAYKLSCFVQDTLHKSQNSLDLANIFIFFPVDSFTT